MTRVPSMLSLGKLLVQSPKDLPDGKRGRRDRIRKVTTGRRDGKVGGSLFQAAVAAVLALVRVVVAAGKVGLSCAGAANGRRGGWRQAVA
eukprot:CAMPEP_0185307358 /NCGR_PEP_ID=MMETSP1363-20130426/16703_1 /TAXON_ID=38817 /ORGANISM="Gephyrocapsa oceanica, Strain RCC1303" /LENGTH=89 /DNA_ID=CAMNT_0027904673 /DNA_START=84 /DNA_END=350 /DNA_ORIENTATION=+